MSEQVRKVVIVTGASSGIGRAIALRAARKGYRLVLNARREQKLSEVAEKVRQAGGEVVAFPGDISRLEDQKRLVEEAVKAYGRIDVLVNNAGLPLPANFSESPVEELRRQWDTNVTALATLTHTALPYLKESHGTVVNIGSSISRFAVPGMGNYAPTKIAVAGLSNALRRELQPQGVDVCLVEPGPINTEFSERAGGNGSSPFYLPAARAAVPIVDLFEHPRRRIVVPGWMAPLLSAAGALMHATTPLVDAFYSASAKRRRPSRKSAAE